MERDPFPSGEKVVSHPGGRRDLTRGVVRSVSEIDAARENRGTGRDSIACGPRFPLGAGLGRTFIELWGQQADPASEV